MVEMAGLASFVNPTETEIDLLIAEAGGDMRQAIKNLLHDLAILALDSEGTASRGYARGRVLPFRLAGRRP